RPHLAGASDAALHLVADEQDAVAIAQVAEVSQIPRRRHDVASLALDWLDENCGNAVGRDFLGEQLLLDPRRAPPGALRLAAAILATVAIGVGDVMNLGQEGREARALHRLARGQTEAAIAPAVEGAEEADDGGTASRVAGQLDRAFDRLRARVRQEYALLARPWREL